MTQCCVEGKTGECPPGTVPGTRSCDAAVKAYCEDEANQYGDPRCSCFRARRFLESAEARTDYVCFHRNCAGSDKLVLREWRDAACPDYVSCRVQLLFGGNVSAERAVVKQDCIGSAGQKVFTESLTGGERTREEEMAMRRHAWRVGVGIGAGVLFVLFLGLAFSRRPGAGGRGAVTQR